MCILHKEKLLVAFKGKKTHRGLCLVWQGRKKREKKKKEREGKNEKRR